MQDKKVYRSLKNRYAGGVAGGVAAYFDIDPIIVRLAFVALALVHGLGLVLYIICWIAIPEADTPERPADDGFTAHASPGETAQQGEEQKQTIIMDNPPKNRNNIIGGVILITLGVLFLIEKVIPEIRFGNIWPFLLIVLGVLLIVKNPMKKDPS